MSIFIAWIIDVCYHVAKQKNWFINRDFKIQGLDGYGNVA